MPAVVTSPLPNPPADSPCSNEQQAASEYVLPTVTATVSMQQLNNLGRVFFDSNAHRRNGNTSTQ